MTAEITELELLTADTHNTFRAELDDLTLMTNTGKVGAKGRTTTKTHKTAAEARKARDKAVAKKIGEGYWAGPWPVPFEGDAGEVEPGDTLRLKVLPKDKGRCPKVRDMIPKHLELHRKQYGWSFVEGPKDSHLWFGGQLYVGRGHLIEPVTPTLVGSSYEQFPFMYGAWPFRPDGEGMLVAHKGDLYDLEIDEASARKIHAFEDVSSLRKARPMLYGADGREVLWAGEGGLMGLDVDADEARLAIALSGEPVKGAARMADGTVAVLQESFLTRHTRREGRYGQIQSIRLRKGHDVGTWLEGQVLVVMTRNTGPEQTLIYGLHDGRLHLIQASGRTVRSAFDLRGAQWLIESAPGGEMDWDAYRVFHVEAAWRRSAEVEPVAESVVLEKPNTFDAIIAALGSSDPRGPEHVAATLDDGGELEGYGLTNGWTPLIYAAWRGAVPIVELLLARGAAIDAVGRDGRSALATAFERGHLEVAEILTGAGAAPVLPRVVEVDGKEVRTESPLAAAALAGYYDPILAMLDGGADPCATGQDGLTALARAASKQNLELATLLHSRGGRARGRNAAESLAAVLNSRSAALLRQVIDEFDGALEGEAMARLLRGQLLSLSVNSTEREVIDLLLEHGTRDATDEGLHRAIDAGHLAAVRMMLAEGVAATGGTITANSPSLHLHHAITASIRDLAIVEALLDGGADVNGLDRRGVTALRYAVARHVDDSFVRFLLERGATVERGEGAWGALHEAAWAGRIDLMTLLLEHGADLNATTSDGRTALTLAAFSQKPEALAFLLERGADPNAGEFTPLMAAATKNDVPALEALVAAGADRQQKGASPHIKDCTPRTAQEHAELARALQAVAHLAKLDNAGFASLQAALEADDVDAVRDLIAAGHDVNGRTPGTEARPLFYARSVATTLLLLDAGADPNAGDKYGNTALIAQASRTTSSTLARIEELLAAGADPAATSNHGQTPLHRAIEYGLPEVAERLIAAGCPVENTRKKVLQPLHLAARYDKLDMLTLLLRHGARVNPWYTTIHGSEETPLHEAARNNAVACARALLHQGADPGAHDKLKHNMDEGGYNAIHRAAEAGHYDVLLDLLRHDRRGARYARITRGATAEELAEAHPRCLELLRAIGPDQSVDAWLARLDDLARKAEAAEASAELWIERVDEQLPEGTGQAPEAVKKQLQARDWVRTTPAGKSLVLRLRRGLHEAAVGDAEGIHDLSILIRAQQMPYHLGPDGARFLVSDNHAIYELDADARTARQILGPEQLGGKVKEVGYTADGFLALVDDTLAHFPLPAAADAPPAPFWTVPAATITGLYPTGTAVVAMTARNAILQTALLRADRDGLRAFGRWDSPMALIWTYQREDGLEAVAYDRWSAPVQVFRLHHLEAAPRTGEPLEAAPDAEAVRALPLVLVKR